MIEYPFDTAEVNGRTIRIADILAAKEIARSDFESALFSFTKAWFAGTPRFDLTTSGSTGIPKRMTVTREQMIASARLTAGALRLARGDRALLCLSPEYIAGKMMLVRSFVTGMKIVAVEPSANPLAASVNAVDLAAMVPLQIHEIVRSENLPQLNAIKKLIIGGGALDEGSRQRLQGIDCACFATYGMTETISHIALMPLNGPHASPYFVALPGIELSCDDRGCLIIRWSQLTHPVVTNDLVELKDKHTFRWLGRFDNIINTGGIKVSPEKIEAVVDAVFFRLRITQPFFISSTPDPRLGDKLLLIVEGSLDEALEGDIRTLLRQRLPRHEMPKEVRTCASFVRTETGKINRKATVNLT